MVIRTAETRWLGDSKNGTGKVKFERDSLDISYSSGSHFENIINTSSEELLGAALASCFNMELAVLLEQAGYAVQAIHTSARVSVEKIDGKNKITSFELDSETKVMPHISTVMLREKAELAKYKCHIPPELAGVDIKLKISHMLMAA